VHWHGIRLENAMDGVPGLTQKPIPPGGSFVYDFVAPDAGTYWYHPHLGSAEQLGRGLSGALIVEEAEPLSAGSFDRDITWLLADYRLDRAAQITPDFLNPMDTSHAGWLGNTVTINGAVPRDMRLRTGERLRLRLINAANARIFALDFTGHAPLILALDGQPLAQPVAPAKGLVTLAPGQRVDLLLDAAGQPGSRHAVLERYYGGDPWKLTDLAYAGEAPLRTAFPAPLILPAPKIPEPDLGAARRIDIAINGGMGGGMGGNMMGGGMMGGAHGHDQGMVWTLNGQAMREDPEAHQAHPPLFSARRDETLVITFRNLTVWAHPMHLHGHSFRLLTRNGQPVAGRPWLDTVLLEQADQVEIAFKADNPGDWMMHCHVLEHQASGMMAVFKVG
jgi:FtsP/CotA-like multicopper oxidase with cupredoxin domain